VTDTHWDRVPIDAQSVAAPLSRFAVFLVVSIGPGDAALAQARDVISGIDDLVKTVGFRDLNGRLSCVVGIGSSAWDRLSPGARPVELHPFPVIRGGVHTAPSTPGDLLFHIRAERADLCFELERLTLDALGDAVTVVDEVNGFRYFDARDLLGFVDGTANPTGADLPGSALIGANDPGFTGCSYVVVQKYLHDLTSWNALSVDDQEAIIGRSKVENIERDSATEVRKSHKTLSTITDEAGTEYDILRDNMPFGSPGSREFGTYFIGYTGRLWVLEEMLRRMFVGDPEGSYDRMLDFSTAASGTTFFVPTNEILGALGVAGDGSQAPTPQDTATPPDRATPQDTATPPDRATPQDTATPPDASDAARDSSLGIGSLRPRPLEGRQ
jgi:porphyrinogen peroxidase